MDLGADDLARPCESAQPGLLEARDPDEHISPPEHDDDVSVVDAIHAQPQDRPLLHVGGAHRHEGQTHEDEGEAPASERQARAAPHG